MKKIVCRNPDGRELAISHSFPFFLHSIEGIYDVQHTITTTKGYNQDGERSTGSTAEKRNILITVQVKEDFPQNRDKIFTFFQPKEVGTLFYYEGDIARKIFYEVESVTNQSIGAVRLSTISLLCPSPLFTDIEETRVSLSTWQGNIIFPLVLVNPFSAAKKVNTLIVNIPNHSNTTLGLRIRFFASGVVVNPQLMDVNRQRLLKVGGEGIDKITMHAGDVLEVTTAQNAKKAILIRNRKETNVINKIAYPPQWPMLHKGDNVFRYNADAGIDALHVDIFKTQTYWGC